MDTKQIIEQLKAPFPSTAIKWRIGQRDGSKGQALPYIDARDVQERLDNVVGAEKWEVTMKPSSVGIIGGIRILLEGHWVTKEDGAQFDAYSDKGNAKELAIKGAFSDALKRAGVMWGIARYLYAYKAPFVEVDENGNFTAPTLPAHMLPEDEREAAAAAQAADATKAETKSTETVTTVAQVDEKPAANEASVKEAVAEAPAPAATPAPAPAPAATPAPASAPAAATPKDSGVNYDALADSAAAAAEPTPAPVAAAPAAAAGTKVANGFDYSHLSLNDKEEGHLVELLGKFGKLQDGFLRNYVSGDSLKKKLNAAAIQWLIDLVDARLEAAKKAA